MNFPPRLISGEKGGERGTLQKQEQQLGEGGGRGGGGLFFLRPLPEREGRKIWVKKGKWRIRGEVGPKFLLRPRPSNFQCSAAPFSFPPSRQNDFASFFFVAEKARKNIWWGLEKGGKEGWKR